MLSFPYITIMVLVAVEVAATFTKPGGTWECWTTFCVLLPAEMVFFQPSSTVIIASNA
jgi:hypothetical protein